MALVTHSEDPRTGCWTSSDTREAVFEAHRGPLPVGAVPEQICGTDECVHPAHQRPVYHVGHSAQAPEAPAPEINSEPVSVSPEPTPVVPVKRGPGRPRKHLR